MHIPDALVHELLANPELKKSDTRTVIFLLQNPGALSNGELATGIGVSKRSAEKSIKRLSGAGILLIGEPQAKRRTFMVQLSEPKEQQAVTEREKDAFLEALLDRFDRLEEKIGSLMDTKGACFNPAPAPDGQNGTVVMPVCSHVDEGKNIQDKKEPESIQNVPELDASIIRERARLAALASFKEKQKQPCAPASIGAEFHALFGVNVPPGFTDMAAVETMIARKKAGKLDNVKSPLGYLSALAGKVSPNVTSSAQLNPVGMSVQLSSGVSSSVNETRLDDVTVDRISRMWMSMNDEQRKPFELTARTRFENQTGRFKVPLELLARSEFNTEQLRNHKGVTP